MMTREQAEVVRTVYTRLIESETENWTEIDDNVEFCSYLSDSELVQESEIRFSNHSGSTFRCSQDHEQQQCFAPYLLESVEAILSLFEKTSELHIKNRYILTYFLAMSEMRMVYYD